MIQWLLALMFLANGLMAKCPCRVDLGKLTCTRNSIVDVPEDLLSCNFDYSTIRTVLIRHQPITELKQNAFKLFTNLKFLSLSYNELTMIDRDAFNGLNLETLFLQHNNLTHIADGALDQLVGLKMLDLRHNDNLEGYTAKAWHFCNSVDVNNTRFKSDERLILHKSLEASEYTGAYCKETDANYSKMCSMKGTQLDCTKEKSLGDAPCDISHYNFESIEFVFPVDPNPSPVANYFEGESNKFFQNFNGLADSMDPTTKYMKEGTLYGTKFDLINLETYTSNSTEKVIIRADTVFTSSSITINHKLEIHARIVSINHPISMKMSIVQFSGTKELEPWAQKEEIYSVGKVRMNKKSYGLITIIRNAANVEMQWKSICKPKVVNVEESGTDIRDWYDTTFVNLIYVCARTVLDTQKNPMLVAEISKFMLGFVYNDTIIDNRETFIAGQKFMNLKQLNSLQPVHNVPSYSVKTISSLTNVMHKKMSDYKQNELALESNLNSASGRLQDMLVEFRMIEKQQQFYFQKEQEQLDMLWNTQDTRFQFDFEHRNEVKTSISGSLNSVSDQMSQMQDQELKNSREQAFVCKRNIESVIQQYETQVSRWQKNIDGSIKIQKEFAKQLKENADKMSNEFGNFKRAIKKYKRKKEKEAATALFQAIFSFGLGLATGQFGAIDKIAIAYDKVNEIQDLANELIQVCEKMNEIQNMIKEIDFSDVANINLKLNTNFKDVLQSSINLKLKGPAFDEIENTAQIKLDDLNQATDNGIEGTAELMISCKAVSDIGKRLINEASTFSEHVLAFSERHDALEVAKAQRNNTLKFINQLEQQIIDLEAHTESLKLDRTKAEEEYVNLLDNMQNEYIDQNNQMRENYKTRVRKSFNKFKGVFKSMADGYNDKIDKLMAVIHKKFHDLKAHSMNQRAMILVLFLDFCDAKFYHTLTTCDHTKMPFMSDDFDTLLAKLIEIQWDTITAPENIQGKPEMFNGYLSLNRTELIRGKKQYVIQNLHDRYEAEINLKDLDTSNSFNDFWRIRLESIFLVLLDQHGHAIQSQGSEFGSGIHIKIRYPNLFNNMDSNGALHSFCAQDFICRSDYSVTEENTVGNDVSWNSKCEVHEEFSHTNYKPSPDGFFTFKILNPERIELDRLHEVTIGFQGSRIVRDWNIGK